MKREDEINQRLDDEMEDLRGVLFDKEREVPERLIQSVLRSIDDLNAEEERRVKWRSTLPIAVVATGGVGLVGASQPSLMLALGLSLVAATYAGLLSSLLTRLK